MTPSEPPRRALVVEDDEAVRRLVATILRRERFEVVEAGDGDEAIEFLSADPTFVLIVLDLMMPRVSGTEVIEHLRKHFPVKLRRVVLITAAAQGRLDLFREEVCAVLRKPFDLGAFIDAIRGCAA